MRSHTHTHTPHTRTHTLPYQLMEMRYLPAAPVSTINYHASKQGDPCRGWGELDVRRPVPARALLPGNCLPRINCACVFFSSPSRDDPAACCSCLTGFMLPASLARTGTFFNSSMHASSALTFFCSCPSRLFLHVHSSFRSASSGLTSRRAHSITALHVTLNSRRYLRPPIKPAGAPPRLSGVSANLAVGQLLPIAPSLPSTEQRFKRPAFHPFLIVQELCESRGGRPGLSVLTSLLVSVDVKNY